MQSRPHWTSRELADRLGVTARTIRRDVDRLRQLGYPVDAEAGPRGGYRLGRGGELPPLLLDDDEAVAVAVALGVATGVGVQGIEAAGLAALAKLERLLPPRLRNQVASLRATTVRLASTGDAVEPALLVAIATAAAGHERIVLAYSDSVGNETERRVEPYRLVATGRRWYLLAFDLDRDDWRTFRVDRITQTHATGHRFTPVEAPDAVAVVQRAISVAPYRYAAKVRVDAPADKVRAQLPPTVGITEAIDGGSCLLTTGADHLDWMLAHLVMLGEPFEVLEPPELRRRAAEVGRRMSGAHRRMR